MHGIIIIANIQALDDSIHTITTTLAKKIEFKDEYFINMLLTH